jgi:hypothetical protein
MLNYKKFLESISNISISKIQNSDIDDVIDVLYSVFGHLEVDKEALKKRVTPRLLNNLSIKISLNNKIVGCYLLAEKSAQEFINDIKLDKIKDFPLNDTKIYYDNITGNGIQGIALAISEEHRGMSLGKELKNYAKNLGYDHIWGVQDKRLENINFWMKTRELLAESSSRYATIEFFK